MVTIKDVAREANVSVATVSRVLNGSGPVSDETRRLIREVAGRMRYVPHSGARSLITSKTETLGVLLPDLYGEFFSEIIRGMDDTAQKNGFHLLISRAYADRHGIETAMKAMRGRVDGVVAMSPDLDEKSLLNLPSTIPVVLLCSVPRGNEIDSLTITNCRGAKEMVAHLVSLGHRRIAIIKGSPRNYDAAERLRGYRLALREAGIALDPLLEREGDFTEAAGYTAALRLFALADRPTAIFAANDSMAIGALSALKESGVLVPEEVAVAGFDDIPSPATWTRLSPRFTCRFESSAREQWSCCCTASPTRTITRVAASACRPSSSSAARRELSRRSAHPQPHPQPSTE